MIWIAIVLFLFALFVDKKRALEFNLAGNWALVILPMLGVISFMLMVMFNMSLAKLIQVYLTVLLLLSSGAIFYRMYKLDEVKFTNQQAIYILLGLLGFVVLLILIFGKY